jgi:hypothetical protein
MYAKEILPMNQDAFLKLAYQYGVLQALDEAGILKHAQGNLAEYQRGMRQMGVQGMLGHNISNYQRQQQGLPPAPIPQPPSPMASRATSPVKMPTPKQTPKPAMPKPPAPKPVQRTPAAAKPPATQAPSNLLTKAPSAIQRRRQILRRFR